MKYMLLLGIPIFLIAVAYLGFTKKPPGAQEKASPSLMFNLTDSELKSFKIAAQNGDCYAGNKLAQYYSFVNNDFDEAVIWYRVAAKCNDVEPKVGLIYILIDTDDYLSIATEVDKLVAEIQAINPSRGEEILKTVQRAKKKAGIIKMGRVH